MSTSSSSASPKVCFNKQCGELKSERPRKGWRLRSGELAELCDRCASAYEEGRYCDTFHLNATGWRDCESCGKRLHCGCIVSAQAFALLDDGGIECLTCARKSFILHPNPSWPSSLFFNTPLPERLKELSVKNWSQLAGSGPVPWRQAPSLFNSSIPQSQLHQRVPYEVDMSTSVDRLNPNARSCALPKDKREAEDLFERLITSGLDVSARNSNAGLKSEEQPSSCLNISQQPSSLREDRGAPKFGLIAPYASANEANGQVGISGTHVRPTPQPQLGKQFHSNLQNAVDSSGEIQMRNGRPRVDARGRSQLHPRYCPRFTDQELQQISGHSNSVITPLFEKMLSASDAGRIGRLVLPKKCAEAYLPPISQPEGLPLKVQDSKGKEWIFQFRFWPNNNSRMYVLEGVTPCIQNMQLQAGDIVTFSRLEPEGKLVMGFRKASTAPASDQDNETSKAANGVSNHGDVSITKTKTGEVALSIRHLKDSSGSPGFSSIDQAELADLNPWSKVDKSGYIAKEALGAKSSIRKRKNSTLSSKSKRPRVENEDLIELKLTWEEAQVLLRPPPNHIRSVVVIEGFEFEEYEDAPVLGKPTLFGTDNVGEKIQWAQCENCDKWRKLPADALLPFKWSCSDNGWDPDRSLCSAPQELTPEQLGDLLQPCMSAASKKMKAAKQEPDNVEALEGLDTLANLAILGEGEVLPSSSSQATTKHPRHRPGCSCIVCIQPPSGKGPKHKQTCPCNVCQTVRRRFRTLMMRREKRQSEKEAETTRKKQQQLLPFSEKLPDDDTLNTEDNSQNQKKGVSDSCEDDPNRSKSSSSPFKCQIDLNIQPERDEELSPGSDSSNMMKMIQDATERCLRQQRLLSSGNSDSTVNHTHSSIEKDGELSNGVTLGGNHLEDHIAALCMNPSASASTSATR